LDTAIRIALKDRKDIVRKRPQLCGSELEPLVVAGGGGPPRAVPVRHLSVPALEPAVIFRNQLAAERPVRLDQPGVVGVEGPLDTLVNRPPPALASAIALTVVLDEPVLREDSQVIAGRAA
jgi:hypothetical protein